MPTYCAQSEQLRTDGGAAAAGQQQQQQRERGAQAAARMGGALEWLEEAAALVEALSGVRIADVQEDALSLALTTHAEAPGTGAHLLLVTFDGEENGNFVSSAVEGACSCGTLRALRRVADGKLLLCGVRSWLEPGLC